MFAACSDHTVDISSCYAVTTVQELALCVVFVRKFVDDVYVGHILRNRRP